MEVRGVYSKFKRFFSIRSKTFLLLLMSYILILAIPAITTFFICGNYQSALTKQYKQQTDNLMETVSSNTAAAIKDIRKLYSYAINYEDINDIMANGSTREYSTSKKVKDFLNPLYCFSANSFESYFIYMKDSDTILAGNAICSSEYYYKSVFGNSSFSYNDWLSSITQPESRLTSYYTDENKTVKMMYHISYTNSSGNIMALCALTDGGIFVGDTDIAKDLADCDVYISNASGDILLSYTNLDKEGVISSITDVKAKAGKNYNFTSARIYVGATPIDVSVVSPRSFHAPIIRRTLRFSIIVIVLCIVLCSLLIVYFCTKHYAPISEFMRLFGEHIAENEYTYIRKNIEHILSENMALSKQTDSFEEKQRSYILGKYVTGSYSPHYIESAFKSNKITFPYERIAVCVFQIKNPNELFADTPGLSDERRYNDLLFIINNVFSELFDTPGYTCDIIDAAGYIFCIVNSSESVSEINGVIENTMNFGLDSIYDNFNLSISYVVSDPVHTPYEFSAACSEALYLLNYKNMLGIDQPLFYSHYNSRPSASDGYFSADTEQILINYISNGQEDKAHECIDEIFINLKSANLPLDRLKCSLIDIASVLLKIPGISISDDEQSHLFSMIFSASGNLSDMKNLMFATISNICGQIKSQTTMYKDQRINNLTKYIDENFCNPNLSLMHIGNEFHLDAGYLSKQFKDYTGVSIVNYINKLRIGKAKDIINAGSADSIETIAQNVGYNNVRTFNRIFEKFEGISPAAYRKSRI